MRWCFYLEQTKLMMAVKVFLVVLLMIAEEKMNRKMMCSFWCTVCKLGRCSSILELVPIFALRFIFKLQSGESLECHAWSWWWELQECLVQSFVFTFFLMRKLPIDSAVAATVDQFLNPKIANRQSLDWLH